MEGILRSIVSAGYRQLQGRGLALFRYDSISEGFPDEWRLVDGEITRRYSTGIDIEGISGQIMQSGKAVLVRDVAEQPSHNPYTPKDVRSFVAAPVMVDEVPWGVFYVNSPRMNDFTEDDLAFIQSLARQLGASVHEAVAGKSGNVELSTVRVLAATVDAKDHYTRHHSTNVSFYARSLAREMNLDPTEVRRVELAGLLHDIGKIAIPDQILQKAGPLTAEERLLVQTHASIGGNILAQASHLQHLVPLVRHHHERYDGKGYPDGLKGDEIPLGAAILNLADSFDTMTTRRIYRAPMNLEAGLAELKRCSGTQFHPEAVKGFERLAARALADGEAWAVALSSVPDAQAPGGDGATWPLMVEAERHEAAINRDPLDLLTEARLLQHVTELPVLLHRVGEQVLDFWSADAVQVYLLNESDSKLQLVWSGGTRAGQAILEQGQQETPIPLTHGLCGWSCMTNQGTSLPDARRDPRWAYGDLCHGPVSVMVSPIESGGVAIGAVQIVSLGESRFGWQDVKVMKVYGTVAGYAIAAAQRPSETAEAVGTDPLTSLRNGHYLRSLLEHLERNRWSAPLSVAFLDGDDLRGINERFGHDAGDQVIRHIARCLSAWRRPEDTVGRLSADEFILFFGGLSLPEASARLERIRMTISETPVELANGRRIYISVSCGVTEVDEALGPHQAMRAAEQAMYNAKRSGKNRIWTVAG